MATTTFHDYNGDGSDLTFNYTFPTYSQAEVIVEVSNVIVDNWTITGGWSATGTKEVKFDNTTGTLYYPEIKYFTAIKGYGLNTLNGNLMELETSAKSLTRDHLAKNATYEPDASGVSQYIMIFHGDEIFGKFARFALYKTSAPVVAGRYLLTKGPANN